MRSWTNQARRIRWAAGACALLWPGLAFAADTGKIDTGDTAFLLISSALVMLMTPGLALFYSGMVRRKNVLGTIMHSFAILALVSVQWVLWGYSLAFGPDMHGILGNLSWAGLVGVGGDAFPDYAATVPHLAFMIFQAMFAVITPALIMGAVAERVRFAPFLAFVVLWATLVYDPLAHWVWGVGGWLRGLGALDFAGGTVVHINSGAAALAAAIVLGKRKGYGREHMAPHNLPFTMLGAGILWFGWFGFNAGSALSAGSLCSFAFVTTHAASAAAALSWMFAEWARRGKPTALGTASGAVAGLVAITPAAGYVTPLAAVAIGGIAGVLCFFAIGLKGRFGLDDSLDVVGVHGVGGTWGALATGLFATKAVNAAGADGLFAGHPAQLGIQALAVCVSIVFSFVLTFAMLKLIDKVWGLRATNEEEETGLDLSQHGEVGYSL